MPKRRLRAKVSAGELTEPQFWALLIGWSAAPGEPGSEFTSMTEARAAWQANRDELMCSTTRGTVPFGAEVFEAKGVNDGK